MVRRDCRVRRRLPDDFGLLCFFVSLSVLPAEDDEDGDNDADDGQAADYAAGDRARVALGSTISGTIRPDERIDRDSLVGNTEGEVQNPQNNISTTRTPNLREYEVREQATQRRAEKLQQNVSHGNVPGVMTTTLTQRAHC